MSLFNIFIGFIGGISLFIFGLNYMSDGLKLISGDGFKKILLKHTSNPFSCILIGIILTILLQSSSVVIAIIIAFVAAGVIKFKQSFGLILGTNIGTTITAFLISFNIERYSLIFVSVGLLIMLLFKKQKVLYFGKILFGFGLLFYGLSIMNENLSYLTDYEYYLNIFAIITENSISTTFIGIFSTILLQSSSASISIVQDLYTTDIITLKTSIALVLGANIGTTSTALFCSFGNNRETKQVVLSHVLFNVIGVIIFTILLVPYSYLIKDLFSGLEHHYQIALSHSIFNIIMVILFIPFINHFTSIIEKIIPATDTGLSFENLILKDSLLDEPAIALIHAKQALVYASKLNIKQTDLFYESLSVPNKSSNSPDIMLIFNTITSIERQLKIYLFNISDHKLTDYESQLHSQIFDSITEFQRIAEYFKDISMLVDRSKSEKLLFGEGLADIIKMTDLIKEMQCQLIVAIEDEDVAIAKKVLELEQDLNILYRMSKETHYYRLKKKKCKADASVYFTAITSTLERVGDRCENVSKSIISPSNPNDLKSHLLDELLK